jgi:hypothetical protein
MKPSTFVIDFLWKSGNRQQAIGNRIDPLGEGATSESHSEARVARRLEGLLRSQPPRPPPPTATFVFCCLLLFYFDKRSIIKV